MRLCVATDHRFVRTPDGKVYSEAGGRAYWFWKRYLSAFDSVTVVARVREEALPPDAGSVANGEEVDFLEIADFQGVRGRFLGQFRLIRRWRRAMRADVAYLLRVPGILGSVIARDLHKGGIPYGVEVIGDPSGVFSRGAFRHPLRLPMQRWAVRQLEESCRYALAASYVTDRTLQEAYPPAQGALTATYSSVELPNDAFTQHPRDYEHRPADRETWNLVTVATLSQRFKGVDILIRALAECIRDGLNLDLTIVGDGRFRSEYEELVRTLHLSERVSFAGQVPSGEEVLVRLDHADMFVLPSRTEGLPRAMIEAMARALPCIGTSVGGIPELIPQSDRVPRDDVAALAAKIKEVLTNPRRMSEMSYRNLSRAQDYRAALLQERRSVFYEEFRKQVEVALARK